jgi:LysM repeat protein
MSNYTRAFLILLAIILVIGTAIYVAMSYVYSGKLRSKLINGDFSLNKLGWRGNSGEVRSDDNGNKYIINGYNWKLHQIISVKPGNSYTLAADTKKGSSNTAARLVVLFIKHNGEKIPGHTINYWHQGNGWESIPKQVINIPKDAAKMIIYMLTLKGTGYHCFDNINLVKNDTYLPAAPSIVRINPPQITQSATETEKANSVTEEFMIQEHENTGVYIVKPGDTLNNIANILNVDMETIIDVNHIENPGVIYPGQKLIIPVNTESVPPQQQ